MEKINISINHNSQLDYRADQYESKSYDSSSTEFSQNQLDLIYPQGIENHYWSVARNYFIHSKLKKIAEKNDNIIEIGHGSGVVTTFLRQKGWKIIGCDLAKKIPTQVDKEFLMYEQDACQLDLQLREKVTIILLLDVLEHVEKPEEFLNKISLSFPHLQKILLTVPARMELWSDFDLFNHHFIRYDFSSIKKVIKQTNFQIINNGYFFQLLYLPALALKILNKNRLQQLIPPQNKRSIFIHQLIGFFLNFTFKLIPSWLPGSSLYTILSLPRKSITTKIN